MPIPAELQQILDETFTTNMAYTEDATDASPADLDKLRRMGERHAARRGLSFRYRLADNPDGSRSVSFWLQVKNKYNRKQAA